MTEPKAKRAATSEWRTTAVVGLLVFAMAVLLHQRALHGEDTRLFVMWLGGDLQALPRHFLYLPTVHALGSLLRPLAASWFTVLWCAAAIGAALGAMAMHRAARRWLPAAASKHWLVLACMTVPPWFFFATAAEIHGVFLLPLGCCWWAFAGYAERPVVWRALLVGGAAGTAAAMHFSGHLLLPTLWLTALTTRVQPPLRLLRDGVLMSLGHAAAIALLALWLGLSPLVQFQAATAFADSWSARFNPAEMPRVLGREILLPFLPWLLVLPLACRPRVGRDPRARGWALAALLTLVVHAPLAFAILSNPGPEREHGAYLMAAAVPLVLTARLVLSTRWFALATLGSAAIAIVLQAPRLRAVYDPQFVVGMQELLAEAGPKTLLVASHGAEMQALTMHFEDQLFVDSDKVRAWVDGEALLPGGRPLSAWFDEQVVLFAAIGRPLLVTESGREALAKFASPPVQALWREHIERSYQLVEVRRHGLHGWLLQPLR